MTTLTAIFASIGITDQLKRNATLEPYAYPIAIIAGLLVFLAETYLASNALYGNVVQGLAFGLAASGIFVTAKTAGPTVNLSPVKSRKVGPMVVKVQPDLTELSALVEEAKQDDADARIKAANATTTDGQ